MSSMFGKGDMLCGRFRVDRARGTGGTAEAYLVFDILVEEEVVCKVSLDLAEPYLQHFRDEYQRLRRMNSAALARPLGFFVHDEDAGPRPVLVLEHVDGPTLGDWKNGKELRALFDCLSQVAACLVALHKEEHAHEDLTIENIIVCDGRAVLIDPFVDPNRTDWRADVKGLAQIIHKVVPPDWHSLVKPLLYHMETNEPHMGIVDVAAQELRTLANAVALPKEIDKSPSIYGQRYRSEVERRREEFHKLRDLREFEILRVGELFRECCAEFGFNVSKLGGEDFDEERRQESARGTLAQRIIHCTSLEAEEAYINWEPRTDFKKPWPYPDEVGVLARGHFGCKLPDGNWMRENLEIVHINDRVETRVSRPNAVTSRLSKARIRRWLAVTIEQCVPGFAEPEKVGGTTPLSTVGADLALGEDGDLLIRDGDVVLVDGLAGLKQAIMLHFSLVRGSWWAEPEAGTRLFEIFGYHAKERYELVRSVAKEEFLVEFGMYIEWVFRFDIRDIDPTRRTLTLELELKPVNETLQEWSFPLEQVRGA